jgi:hypothetical protein
MRTRTLSLKRETLSTLTTDELLAVAGGQQELTHLGCNPTNECGHGPSFDERCPTLPVQDCLSRLLSPR